MSKLMQQQEQYLNSHDFSHGRWVRVTTVADRLRQAMDAKGVDQTILADMIGVTQGTISLILVGKTRRSKHLPEIATALDVTYDWLVGREPSQTPVEPSYQPLTPAETQLVEAVRRAAALALQNAKRALNSQPSPPPPPLISLPSEDALAEMYEGQLRGLARLSGAELARALARRLPRALARLQAGELYEETDDAPEDPEASGHPVEDHPVARRAQRR